MKLNVNFDRIQIIENNNLIKEINIPKLYSVEEIKSLFKPLSKLNLSPDKKKVVQNAKFILLNSHENYVCNYNKRTILIAEIMNKQENCENVVPLIEKLLTDFKNVHDYEIVLSWLIDYQN